MPCLIVLSMLEFSLCPWFMFCLQELGQHDLSSEAGTGSELVQEISSINVLVLGNGHCNLHFLNLIHLAQCLLLQ